MTAIDEDHGFEHTIDFLNTLSEDVEAHYEDARSAEAFRARRTFARAVFACIEGHVNVMRGLAIQVCYDHLKPGEMEALREVDYAVSESGQVYERPTHLRLKARVRLVCDILNRECPFFKVDFNSAGWSKVMSTIAVRDRVTHPKLGGNPLQLTLKEVEDLHAASTWMSSQMEQLLEAWDQQAQEAQKERLFEFLANMDGGNIEVAVSPDWSTTNESLSELMSSGGRTP